jgi:hypothetical protein
MLQVLQLPLFTDTPVTCGGRNSEISASSSRGHETGAI